ncbi:hypothetical protein FHX37_0410 [Haloactinospora alba]|uniref:Uncharacterized protein n=1 Tax=Haloactinospora alba TaxID=405555 RepID=A0A543NFB4_9ACTN|nr:hypothetical protein [Haloactinospora alba]TQN30529.1 hypothetical protein FHX37_0410 [Haloactinospora alba]
MPSTNRGADPDESVFLLELGPDGRVIRRVEVLGEDDTVASWQEEGMNPPFDLRSPELATAEVDEAVFAAAREGARKP